MTYDRVLLVRMLVSIVAGGLGVGCNSWIVYINLKDWRRGFHLSPPDQILSFMALIDVASHVALCFDISSLATEFYGFFDPIHLSIIGVLVFLASCNIWLTACLSVYYYVRIVNFTGGLLLVLKMRISKLLPKILVVSTIECFIIALPSIWNIYAKKDEEAIGNFTNNSTEDNIFLIITPPYLIIVTLWCIVPLMLTLLPIGLTLSSLWRHMKRMNMNKSDSSRPQTQAHITAVRTMVLLVTLHTGFHAASYYILMKSFNFVDTSMICSWYFVILYPTMQSFVMITGNSKLKKATRDILRPCVMCFSKRHE